MAGDFEGLPYDEEAWPDQRIVQELRHLGGADSRKFMLEAVIELARRRGKRTLAANSARESPLPPH